jgi:outer membrane protein assembly factor BamB
MMLRFNKCIFSYDINCVDGDIIFRSEENTINSLNGRVFPSLPMEIKSFYFGKINNWYWADNCNGQIYFVDSLTNEVIYQNKRDEFEVTIGWEPVVIDDSKILVSRWFGNEKKISIFNLKDFSFVDVSYQGNYGYPEYNLVVDRVRDRDRKISFLIAFDTATGTEKWRYDDFHEYENNIREKKVESVHEIFGVAEGLLWVQLTGGRVIGISPERGECIKNIDDSVFDATDYELKGLAFSGPKTLGTKFLQEESKIVLLPYGEYAEIDLKSERPVMVCYATKQSFKDAGVDCSGSMIVHGNMIYFCDVMSTKVGAFDRDKKELVWHDNLKNYHEKAGMPAKIMATDNHLYFQDNNNNLFVFEKVKGD